VVYVALVVGLGMLIGTRGEPSLGLTVFQGRRDQLRQRIARARRISSARSGWC
jgi:hypothetical protein